LHENTFDLFHFIMTLEKDTENRHHQRFNKK